MLKKVDQPLKQRWELMFDNDKITDLDSFLKFIEHELVVWKRKCSKVESKFSFRKKSLDASRVKTNVINSAIVKNGNYRVMCNQNHALFKRFVFNSKPVKERKKIV